ncbi:MAG TPA: alcohol dehydrogenase catalytic domain-containing protein [Candidatus Lokiarchaeia archaeon]|nr:alcohol dehydrogenase catalytic domain-containing protein [Candidatus Lokiarchaeia archaeon]
MGDPTAPSELDKMPALMFEFKLGKLAKSKLRGSKKNPSGYWKPGGAVGIQQVPRPKLVADDWVVVKTVYCGICGSDMHELQLEGAIDNPVQTFLTFPQIMGHEIVGIIDQVGPSVTRLQVGDRVAITPWFPCKARGISPECPRCQQGDYQHCHNFQRGNLPTGMHVGVTRGFGGYAPFVAVHESQCFVIPDAVTFEQAAVADPFCVAFHACLLLDPKPDQVVMVFGLGVIGLCAITCLKNLFGVSRILGVDMLPFKAEQAAELGAEHVFLNQGSKLVEEVANYLGAEVFTPTTKSASKWTVDGVDGIIDTIASSSTLEAGIRCLTTQGRLIFAGISTPERLENTPHYFKELEIMGSNSFSTEEFEGKRAHAFVFFLDFLAAGRIDTGPFVTHKFPLEQYQEAFNATAFKRKSQSVKVVFDFTNSAVKHPPSGS